MIVCYSPGDFGWTAVNKPPHEGQSIGVVLSGMGNSTAALESTLLKIKAGAPARLVDLGSDGRS